MAISTRTPAIKIYMAISLTVPTVTSQTETYARLQAVGIYIVGPRPRAHTNIEQDSHIYNVQWIYTVI